MQTEQKPRSWSSISADFSIPAGDDALRRESIYCEFNEVKNDS